MRLFSLIALLSCISSITNAQINDYFSTIKTDPLALYTFFKQMPKGGELHYHFAGSVYAETILQKAMNENYCVDPVTLEFHQNNGACYGVTSKQLKNNEKFYNKIIRAWSMKDFIPNHESGHDHFFSAFAKFMPIQNDFRTEFLIEILNRAAAQHELYLEIIMFPLPKHNQYAKLINNTKTFAEKRKILLEDQNFKNSMQNIITDGKKVLNATRTELACDKQPAINPACAITTKLQFYVERNHPLNEVFAQALAGFEIAAQSNEIIGVNLVEPEDGLISLQDYKKHMQIFNFMHSIYPSVHIALHAGELSSTAVKPNDLNFHINSAILDGKAERIGHGVDIAYEENNLSLMHTMATKQIPVEINLTSNREILNVSGKLHPLNYYLQHKVPVVLSTDDEGMLRTDLTSQYVTAVIEHNLDYPTIKMLNRNALTYSFLPGKSIWADPATAQIVTECKDLNSDICKKFIATNEKAKLQYELEQQLITFEKDYIHAEQ